MGTHHLDRFDCCGKKICLCPNDNTPGFSQYDEIRTPILRHMVDENKKQIAELRRKANELEQKTNWMNANLSFRNPYNPYSK